MKTYNTEIISVGTELLLGHITNKLPDSCQGFCFTCTMHGN